ncbi:hypothetical protein FH972_023122 [Carpinus fangiana]|uniref:Beta-hexosaminidase n=1 Tax=Carpinus fangiana TaxID=176857 RepID=A0A5N6KU91_9ROSI|nr:hypothetical protein FH972_023122 [Carpinus fangiana]
MKFLAGVALLAPLAAAVWPIPSHYSHGDKTLWISDDVAITYQQPLHFQQYSLRASASAADAGSGSQRIVQKAVSRAYETIFKQSYVPWRFNHRFSDFEPKTTNKKFIQSIALVQNKTDAAGVLKPKEGQFDEGYTLVVGPAGKVTITSASSLGLARGLTTFTQLFFAHSKGGAYTKLAPVRIDDSPKFAHRGLNMDVSRNFFPIDNILRTIDALAYNKMNRLHLHITDAQSWPLEIPALPELSAKGAYGPGMTYSPADVQRIYTYGALLGVAVVMEIDQPGHTSSIWHSHPELIAAWNEQPNWITYAAEPPSGTLKLNSPAVYKFLSTLYKDLLPRLSPLTSYFHTGGDEIKYAAYKLDDTVKSDDPAVLQPLLQKYIDTVHKHVRDAGLTPVVWEEIVLTYNLTVGKDVLIQAWQEPTSAVAITNMGHKALVGDYNFWYLDCGHGQWLDFEPGVASMKYYPYQDYCAPLKSWRQVYSYDPLTSIAKDKQHLIVGGEVHMWAEQTDALNFDGKAWPRAAAAAEVLWSGAKDPATGQNRSQIEASPRLADMRERLVARGVAAEPVQMPYCQQDGSQCLYLASFDDA